VSFNISLLAENLAWLVPEGLKWSWHVLLHPVNWHDCAQIANISLLFGHFALKIYLSYGPLRVGANFHSQFSLPKSRVLGGLVCGLFLFLFGVLLPHS